jgi:hypothetical protein
VKEKEGRRKRRNGKVVRGYFSFSDEIKLMIFDIIDYLTNQQLSTNPVRARTFSEEDHWVVPLYAHFSPFTILRELMYPTRRDHKLLRTLLAPIVSCAHVT